MSRLYRDAKLYAIYEDFGVPRRYSTNQQVIGALASEIQIDPSMPSLSVPPGYDVCAMQLVAPAAIVDALLGSRGFFVEPVRGSRLDALVLYRGSLTTVQSRVTVNGMHLLTAARGTFLQCRKLLHEDTEWFEEASCPRLEGVQVGPVPAPPSLFIPVPDPPPMTHWHTRRFFMAGISVVGSSLGSAYDAIKSGYAPFVGFLASRVELELEELLARYGPSARQAAFLTQLDWAQHAYLREIEASELPPIMRETPTLPMPADASLRQLRRVRVRPEDQS